MTPNRSSSLLGVDAGRADWIKSTYITDDTEAIAAKLDERAIAATVDYAKQSTRFDGLKLDPVTARKLKLLKLSLTIATPVRSQGERGTDAHRHRHGGTYGKGKYCPSGPESCKDLEELSKILAESRDPKALQDAWTGWHAISRPIRKDFVRYVELANKGARQLGFKDNGAMWRSKYDMAPDDFAKELDRLWEQVKPLYLSLHAYVRNRLREKYGDAVPATGAIPAHLLGNMWAQDWDNIYPLIAPRQCRPRLRPHRAAQEAQHRLEADGEVRRGLLHVARLRAAAADLLGALALPQAEGPRRGVPRQRLGCRYAWTTCASRCASRSRARISSPSTTNWATTSISAPTRKQPPSFRDSANDGFHEAVGDTIALSITPEYLVKIGLLDKAPGHLQGHRTAAAQARWRRSRSCPSAW